MSKRIEKINKTKCRMLRKDGEKPACVSTCCYRNLSDTATSVSGRPQVNEYRGDFVNKFEQLGGLGQINGNCKNYIGNCAEQHAANQCSKKVTGTVCFDKFSFSKTRRPRTLEIIKACANCRYLFKI